MKKFLLVLAIGSFAVACNNSSSEAPKTDSTTVKVDSNKTVVDTTKHDSTTVIKTDSVKKDTVVKK